MTPAPIPVDLPDLPALVVGQVHHSRHRPLGYAFTHRHYQWLVDLDRTTPLPWWLRRVARVRPADHLAGSPDVAALRANVLRVAARDGVDVTSVTRIVLLAHARVLGHAFDPLSVFWCLDAAGLVRAVVLEVHNTYGGRHAYVVTPDARGGAKVDKTFPVSPFNDVDGTYAVALRLSPQRVSVAIRLRVDGRLVLTASVTGRCVRATPAAVARVLVSHPVMTQQVSALIRYHGVRLWARRLPVRPRPAASVEHVR